MTSPSSSGAPDPSAKDAFIGHYGTVVATPVGLRLAGAAFGRDGDEVVSFESAGPGAAAAELRICSRMARRGYAARKAIAEAERKGLRNGLPLASMSQSRLDDKTWALEIRGEAKGVVVARETEEYVYVASAAGLSLAVELLKGVRQTPRADWDASVLAMRKLRGDDFNPDLRPPKEYASPLGYTLTLPAGLTYHKQGTPESEAVFLFPIRHGVLVSRDILTSGSEYENFSVISLQAAQRGRIGKGPKEFLQEAGDMYRRTHRLTDKDLRLSQRPDGHWILERLRPRRLRYESWEKDGVMFVVVGASPLLMGAVVSSIR